MMFGEYLVLRGSQSLSFPLELGQTLSISPAERLRWESHGLEGMWFEADFDDQLNVVSTNREDVASTLTSLLKMIAAEKPDLDMKQHFVMKADFNLNWGIGSSSTFISLLSQWSGVNPYELLSNSFGGSGYDIACATAVTPITFKKDNQVQEVSLSEKIQDKLLFVYLGKKQNSKKEVNRFREKEITAEEIKQIDSIIENALKTSDIKEFEVGMKESENLLGPILGLIPLKQHKFADYPFEIKSLGAWGGDFFMATYRDLEAAKNYFKEKGFDTIFTYKQLVKCKEI